tara:strand:+ start:318 stop:554 length:237 start_codon:yes stop_codon:yes gene_type:complete
LAKLNPTVFRGVDRDEFAGLTGRRHPTRVTSEGTQGRVHLEDTRIAQVIVARLAFTLKDAALEVREPVIAGSISANHQ